MSFDCKVDINCVVNIYTTDGKISVEDQKILDSILARVGALARKLQKVDALTPPPEK